MIEGRSEVTNLWRTSPSTDIKSKHYYNLCSGFS